MSELPCRQPSPRLCPGTGSTAGAWVLPTPWPKSDRLDTVRVPSQC